MGTTVLPFASLTAFKEAALRRDTNGNGGLDPGDTILYTIRVVNNGIIPITDIDILDTPDLNTTYVPDTTRIDGAAIPDDAAPATAFPLDVDAGHPAGYTIFPSPAQLDPGQQAIITFESTVNDPFPTGARNILNTVTVSSQTETFVDAETSPVPRGQLAITKASSAAGSEVDPGQTIDYTVTVSNASAAGLTGIRVTDALPAGTQYVAGSTSATGPRQRFVRDLFGAVAYDNNDGAQNWLGNWVETDASGGAQDPATGDVVVDGATGELRLRAAGSIATRQADLSGFVSASLSFDFQIGTGVDESDATVVEASANGSTFTVLETFTEYDGDNDQVTSGRRAYDISGFISATTTVRVRVTDGTTGGSEFFYVDDFAIRAVGASTTAQDDFSSGNYSGGSGWAGPWVENDPSGDPAGPNDGHVQVIGGELCLHDNDPDTDNEPSAARTVDLSGGQVFASFAFDWQITNNGIDDDDQMVIEASSNGVDYFPLDTITDQSGAISGTRSFDLSTFIADATTIRFRIPPDSYQGNNEVFCFDNVVITAGVQSSFTRDNAGGGNPQLADGVPADLVLPVDEFALAPGESLTVTYSVTADSPLDQPTVENTAFATAFENPNPVQATVVDPVSPGGLIGDLVWFDTDRDGVYDIGEPGLANVRVWLDVDGDGIFTPGIDRETLTDASGQYTFDHLPPQAVPYRVHVDESTLPGLAGGLVAPPWLANPGVPVLITSDEQVRDVDFGYVAAAGTGVVGDYIWNDADADGVQDPGEIGFPNVIVNLIDPSTGAVVDTVTTDAAGNYLFTGVVPDQYLVELDAANFVGGGALDGFSPTSGPQSMGSAVSPPFTVIPGQGRTDIDFGYRDPNRYSISDTVWLDRDGDGVLDPNESGIEGVTVNLVDAAGNIIGTAITDTNGEFTFNGVPDGDYTVVPADTNGVLLPFFPTTAEAAARSLSVTVAGGPVTGIHFGFNGAASVGDLVWSDADGDGVRDPGEPGLGGVTIDLIDIATGSVLATTTTAADGSYLFANLPPGTYIVEVTDTASVLSGSFQTFDPSEPGGPCTICNDRGSSTVNYSTADLEMDFGYRNNGLADILGTVWEDLDADGVIETPQGEPGINGVTVVLLDAGPDGQFGTDDDLVVAKTTTAADGTYSFVDVPDNAPGENYRVAVTDEAGVLEGYRLTSSLDQIDVVVAGVDVEDVDFGYVRSSGTASIGDRVWLDIDANGIENGSEPGILDVTLELWPDLDGDGIFEPGGDDGPAPIATTVTDANGEYRFDGLDAGRYFVNVDDTTLPVGNPAGALVRTNGATSNSDQINLSEGQFYDLADFGYGADGGAGVGGIGDTVWFDGDGDGVRGPGELGIPGVTVELYDDAGTTLLATAVTGPDGSYLFTGLPPANYTVIADATTLPAGYDQTPTNTPGGRLDLRVEVISGLLATWLDYGFEAPPGVTGSIGDRVFLDADGDGIDDPGEPGIEGVTISLLDSSGAVIASTTTDADGAYDFSGVPAGDYRVEVTDHAGILDALNLTAGANPTAIVSLAAGEDYNDADFGYAAGDPQGERGAIGSVVWHDLDGDGFRDPGEPGLENVTLDLWHDRDGNGVIEPSVDNYLRTVATNATGEYAFKGLPPADYLVTVSDWHGVLAGFTKTFGTSGVDDNSQVDPYSVTITTAEPTNVTADFGYWTDPGGGAYSISGTTFFDVDGDALFEPPLGGGGGGDDGGIGDVTMYLYRDLDGNGQLDPGEPQIASTMTDAAGDYIFTNLPDGDYIVTADAGNSFLAGKRQTTQSLTAGVEPVTLAGADSTDHDFGYTTGFTLALISEFGAYMDGGRLVVEWTTASEVGTVGFYLYRWDGYTDDYTQVNETLLASLPGAAEGNRYRIVDPGAGGAEAQTYALVEVETFGTERVYGPYEVEPDWSRGPRGAALVGDHLVEAKPRSERFLGRLASSRNEVANPLVSGSNLRPRLQLGSSFGGSSTSIKIGVENLGLHYVDAGELASLWGQPEIFVRGLIAQGGLTLWNGDDQISWLPGEGGLGLFFHGEPVESIYTRTNVYRLEMGAGSLMETRPAGAPPAYPSATSSQAEVRIEEDRFAATVVARDPESDYWYWEFVNAGDPTHGSKSLTVPVAHPAPTEGMARLEVDLFGATDTPATNDHHVVVRLNGNEVGESLWDGVAPHRATFLVSQSLLQNGPNVIEVEGVLDTGAPYSIFYVDGFDLSYRRLHIADNDSLVLTAGSAPVVSVDGFSSADLMLFDVTEPRAPRLVKNPTVVQDQGLFRMSFIPEGPDSAYLAVAVPAIRLPVLEADAPSDLRNGSGEYLVIAPASLAAGAEALATYRESQGFDAQWIFLEDVYDEFSQGLATPHAIRDFLSWAWSNWSPRPRWIALAGAGTFDYKDNHALGGNLLPPLMVSTNQGLFASDSSLADVVGDDGLPEMATGRIPALTNAELLAYVQKLATHEATLGAPWRERVLLAAGDFDIDGNFPTDSEAVASLIPAPYSLERVYLSQLALGEARTQLFDELSEGVLLANWIGHGGLDRWSGAGLLLTRTCPPSPTRVAQRWSAR